MGSLLGTLILILLPPLFPRYTVKVLSTESYSDDRRVIYDDLNGDGISEKIMPMHHQGDRAVIMIQQGTKSLPEIDLEGKFLKDRHWLVTGDYDHNGYREIFTITRLHDSAFLWVREPMKNDGLCISKLFITKLCRYNSDYDCVMVKGFVEDIDCDGKEEFIFAINTGWCLEPRAVFIYDPETRMLIRSPTSAAAIVDMQRTHHQDYPTLFILSTAAVSNSLTWEVPYSDSSTWLQVLKPDLSFLFPPIEFPVTYSLLTGVPVIVNGKLNFLCLLMNYGTTSAPHSLTLFDSKGKPLFHKILQEPHSSLDPFLVVSYQDDDTLLYLLNHGGVISRINPKADTISQMQINGGIHELAGIVDANGDRQNDLIFIAPGLQKIYFVTSDLKNCTPLKLPFTLGPTYLLSTSGEKSQPFRFYLNSENHLYEIEYARNQWSWMRLPFQAIIFLLSAGFVLMIQMVTARQIRKKIRTENSIRELQIRASMNQLDPHFTFNVMNTIGSVVLNGKREKAYDLIINFSHMIRSSLKSAGEITHTLEDELKFLDRYLEIQQETMVYPFVVEKEIDTEIDLQMRIPKMILHTFVENAVKHGLKPLERPGKIIITATREGKDILFTIADDGVGRKDGPVNQIVSTGKGLMITREMIQLLNSQNRNHIHLIISNGKDLKGTLVALSIPLDYQYTWV